MASLTFLHSPFRPAKAGCHKGAFAFLFAFAATDVLSSDESLSPAVHLRDQQPQRPVPVAATDSMRAHSRVDEKNQYVVPGNYCSCCRCLRCLLILTMPGCCCCRCHLLRLLLFLLYVLFGVAAIFGSTVVASVAAVLVVSQQV